MQQPAHIVLHRSVLHSTSFDLQVGQSRRDHAETSDTGKSYRHRSSDHSSVVLLAASSTQQQNKTASLQNYATFRGNQHYLSGSAINIRDLHTIRRYRNHLVVSQPGDINDARCHSDSYMFQQARHSASKFLIPFLSLRMFFAHNFLAIKSEPFRIFYSFSKTVYRFQSLQSDDQYISQYNIFRRN